MSDRVVDSTLEHIARWPSGYADCPSSNRCRPKEDAMKLHHRSPPRTAKPRPQDDAATPRCCVGHRVIPLIRPTPADAAALMRLLRSGNVA